MDLTKHTRTLLTGCILSTTLVTAVIAQQGDKKGQKMIDPIPAEKIPPSPYLSLEDSLKKFKLASGYVIEPVASGKDVYKSVALSFDGNGRAWSCEMISYMPDLDGNGEDAPNGRIRVLEDTNGDGKTDRATTFIDNLVLPRAVAVTSDGCLYTSGQALYFIKREGTKAVGDPILVDAKYSTGGNPEHSANTLLYGHDNWYYNAKSKARYRRINGEWEKDTTRMRGQWGMSKDNAGRLYFNSNSILLQGEVFSPMFMRGNPHFNPRIPISPIIGSNEVHPIRITPGVNRAYTKNFLDSKGRLQNATAACGVTIYRGDNFPPDRQGMAFICEPAGDLIKAVKITRNEYNQPTGTHPYGQQEFLASTDEWFMPCNLYTAPDGTLWIVDMYFGLLQHKGYMTTYLRKQYASRKLDQPEPNTGRIYRVRYKKNKLSAVPRMESLTTEELIPFLSHGNGTIRDIAQRRIVESGDLSIVDTLTKLITKTSNPMAQIHALWAIDGLGKTNTTALLHGLKSNHPDVVNNALDITALNRIKTSEIQKALLALRDKPQTLHAHIRAMAAAGLSERALQLTLNRKHKPFVREAFLSGLGLESIEFRKKHAKVRDSHLDNLLSKAAQAIQKSGIAKASPGAHLKGQNLLSFKRGKDIYLTKAACAGCHGAGGEGLDNLGPPLDQSEWVTKSPERLTKILLHGMTGPLTVNGKKYTPTLPMPGLHQNESITDQDLADVMTYIRNSWNNKAAPTKVDLVKKTRAATENQGQPYQARDLE